MQKKGKITALSWKNLSKIRTGDSIGISGTVPWEGIPHTIGFIPTRGTKDFHFPSESNDDLLWFLGFYIGDGYIDASRVCIAVPPKDKSHRKVMNIARDLFGLNPEQRGVVLRYNRIKFVDFLHALGFTGSARTKIVPSWVFVLPKSQITAFIEGYIAADGHRRANHKNLSITSVNYDLLYR